MGCKDKEESKEIRENETLKKEDNLIGKESRMESERRRKIRLYGVTANASSLRSQLFPGVPILFRPFGPPKDCPQGSKEKI